MARSVFCRTRTEVDQLTETMNARGYRAEALHGGMDQAQRDRVMNRLRDGTAELLVATDVAARGLDVDTLTHVVNYDVPSAPESYVHRIGRVGRAGREGVAITLAEPREQRLLANIERLTRQPIKIEKVPSVADLRAAQLEQTVNSIRESLSADDLEEYYPVLHALRGEADPRTIALAVVRLYHEAAGNTVDETEIPEFTARPERKFEAPRRAPPARVGRRALGRHRVRVRRRRPQGRNSPERPRRLHRQRDRPHRPRDRPHPHHRDLLGRGCARGSCRARHPDDARCRHPWQERVDPSLRRQWRSSDREEELREEAVRQEELLSPDMDEPERVLLGLRWQLIAEDGRQQMVHHRMQPILHERRPLGLALPHIDVPEAALGPFDGKMHHQSIRWCLAEPLHDPTVEVSVDGHILGERICHRVPRSI